MMRHSPQVPRRSWLQTVGFTMAGWSLAEQAGVPEAAAAARLALTRKRNTVFNGAYCEAGVRMSDAIATP